ncbi:MAG: tRNA guanosine(34) transglycosylase Tgt [Patescibacteria group bacterium]
MKKFKFELKKEDGKARLGKITTAHGEIDTPVFMPCGTRATVKTTNPEELKDIGVQILLGNTYHLYLKPGDRLIKRMGGLHKFMGWDRPILTDSGGFQVFSLGTDVRKKAKLMKIYEDRVEFRSYIDGSKHTFTPEKVLDIQDNLGTDIAMVLDECVSGEITHEYAKKSMEITHKWAKRAKEYTDKKKFDMAVFGIAQGGIYDDLRVESAKYINSLDFDGNAIGGLVVETKEQIYRVLNTVIPNLEIKKPRYLMGVGQPEDILEAVEGGVDMFDAIIPTRLARHGTVFTYRGKMNLKTAKFRENKTPIEKGCDCYACQNFSGAYIHHLLRVDEILGIRLTTIHNLRFMMRLMEDIRTSIQKGEFQTFKKSFIKKFER